MKFFSLGKTPSPHVLVIPLLDRYAVNPYTLNYERYVDARRECGAPVEMISEHYRTLGMTEIGLMSACEANLQGETPVIFELNLKSDKPLSPQEMSTLQSVIEVHNQQLSAPK